jgi:hypothetical protein
MFDIVFQFTFIINFYTYFITYSQAGAPTNPTPILLSLEKEGLVEEKPTAKINHLAKLTLFIFTEEV